MLTIVVVVIVVGGGMIVSTISIGLETGGGMITIGIVGVADTTMKIGGEVATDTATADLLAIVNHHQEEEEGEEATTVEIGTAEETSLGVGGRDVLVRRAGAGRGIGIGAGIDAALAVAAEAAAAAAAMIVIIGSVRVGAEAGATVLAAAAAEVVVWIALTVLYGVLKHHGAVLIPEVTVDLEVAVETEGEARAAVGAVAIVEMSNLPNMIIE